MPVRKAFCSASRFSAYCATFSRFPSSPLGTSVYRSRMSSSRCSSTSEYSFTRDLHQEPLVPIVPLLPLLLLPAASPICCAKGGLAAVCCFAAFAAISGQARRTSSWLSFCEGFVASASMSRKIRMYQSLSKHLPGRLMSSHKKP